MNTRSQDAQICNQTYEPNSVPRKSTKRHFSRTELDSHKSLRITQLAGGPLTSICEVDSVIRAIPGLSQTISNEVDVLNTRMLKLIDAYLYGEVSDEDARKYAT